jgi:NADH-quinone oxidoreductase subunit H
LVECTLDKRNAAGSIPVGPIKKKYKIMIEVILTILCSLLAVAFFTISERKLMASIQRRKGPNVTGFWGTLQAIADGLKLLFKEIIIPIKANWVLFLLAPSITLITSLSAWVFIPFSQFNYITSFDFSLLFVYALSSIGVYGIIGAGWASNSKYAFLGSLRSTAQLISYEISIGLLLLPVAICANSYNLVEIVQQQKLSTWFCFPLLPICIIFFISLLAETNRAPFDLPEAEAEIVAGYNVEYSSMAFAMFFLAEYSNILWLSILITICFFGGWLSPINVLPDSSFWLILKSLAICFLIIKTRANYPRYRYDQLMNLGWKTFLPIAIGYLIFIVGVFQNSV